MRFRRIRRFCRRSLIYYIVYRNMESSRMVDSLVHYIAAIAPACWFEAGFWFLPTRSEISNRTVRSRSCAHAVSVLAIVSPICRRLRLEMRDGLDWNGETAPIPYTLPRGSGWCSIASPNATLVGGNRCSAMIGQPPAFSNQPDHRELRSERSELVSVPSTAPRETAFVKTGSSTRDSTPGAGPTFLSDRSFDTRYFGSIPASR